MPGPHRTSEKALCPPLSRQTRPPAFSRASLLFILRSTADLEESENAAGPSPDCRILPSPALRAMLCSRHPGNRAGSSSPPRGLPPRPTSGAGAAQRSPRRAGRAFGTRAAGACSASVLLAEARSGGGFRLRSVWRSGFALPRPLGLHPFMCVWVCVEPFFSPRSTSQAFLGRGR